MAAFSERPDVTPYGVRWRLKLAEYEYEVVYKAGKINANAEVDFQENQHQFSLLRFRRKSVPKRYHPVVNLCIRKGGTVTNSGPKETQPI